MLSFADIFIIILEFFNQKSQKHKKNILCFLCFYNLEFLLGLFVSLFMPLYGCVKTFENPEPLSDLIFLFLKQKFHFLPLWVSRLKFQPTGTGLYNHKFTFNEQIGVDLPKGLIWVCEHSYISLFRVSFTLPFSQCSLPRTFMGCDIFLFLGRLGCVQEAVQ